MTKLDVEQRFDAIVESCIQEMDDIDCPQSDYLSALRAARSRFNDQVEMVEKMRGEDDES